MKQQNCRLKRKSKCLRVGGNMMMSALSKAPFLGTFTDTVVGNSQYGPLLKALKSVGFDTQRLIRQIVAKGADFQHDPVSAVVELILQNQDQLLFVLQNLAKDSSKFQLLAAAISTSFSDKSGTMTSYIMQTLQALAAKPEMLQSLCRNREQLKSSIAQLFRLQATPGNNFLPKPVTQSIAGTSGYSQLPVLPMAGQAERSPASSTIASSNNYGYLHTPANQQQMCPQQSNCCPCACNCCQCPYR